MTRVAGQRTSAGHDIGEEMRFESCRLCSHVKTLGFSHMIESHGSCGQGSNLFRFVLQEDLSGCPMED